MTATNVNNNAEVINFKPADISKLNNLSEITVGGTKFSNTSIDYGSDLLPTYSWVARENYVNGLKEKVNQNTSTQTDYTIGNIKIDGNTISIKDKPLTEDELQSLLSGSQDVLIDEQINLSYNATIDGNYGNGNYISKIVLNYKCTSEDSSLTYESN